MIFVFYGIPEGTDNRTVNIWCKIFGPAVVAFVTCCVTCNVV